MKAKLLKIWDTCIIILSLYTVGEFFIELVTKIPKPVYDGLETADFIICLLFLLDWTYYFFVTPRKERLHYCKFHLIDLVASVPFAQILRPLRIVRAVRIVRLFRLVRGFKGAERFISIFMKNRARSAMSIYILVTAVIYIYGTLGIYNFEYGVNKNISTFGDAMWMAFTTLTTVGYGDCYPITPGGRLLCSILVLTGMGLFSLFTAEFATYILKELKIHKDR